MDKEQLIINYFENKLSEEEQKIFYDFLKKDAAFATEVRFQENVKKAITLNNRNQLKQKLQSFENKKVAKKSFTLWYVAATFLLFLGGGFWFLNQNTDTTVLYEEYYQSYPNVIAPTVRGNEIQDIKSTAFFEYDNGNFETSLALFSQLYEKDRDDYALFYAGLSLIELSRHNEALVLFDKFDLNKNNGFTPFIKWYMALSYLKTQEKDKAQVLLEELAIYENPQQQVAQELLNKLK